MSATDIKLMALVYQLEKQNVGVDHLKSIPENMRVLSLKPPQLPSPDPVGFFKVVNQLYKYKVHVYQEVIFLLVQWVAL